MSDEQMTCGACNRPITHRQLYVEAWRRVDKSPITSGELTELTHPVYAHHQCPEPMRPGVGTSTPKENKWDT